mgnify:CR=1 FL=1
MAQSPRVRASESAAVIPAAVVPVPVVEAAPAAPLTDNELVAAALRGDERAFAELFERYRPLVARLGYRFFTRREQVEDVMQESFTKAYFALGDYQGGYEASFAAWLTRITVHTCYDELRRQRRRAENELGDLSDDEAAYLHERLRDQSAGGNVEGTAVTRDLADKLLRRLRPEDRLLLTLVNLEEKSVAEIADLMGWTSAKVKMRAHRAREALRRVLHKYV